MEWMKNRIAISIAVVTLLVAIVALGATIAITLQRSEDAQPVPPAEFVAVGDDVAPGQDTQKSKPDDSAESEEPADKDDAPEPEADSPEPDPPKKTETQKKAPAKRPPRSADREEWKSSVLQIVTNFDRANVTVNGLDYPEYYEPGQPQGMVLPAGGPYDVEVEFGENVKHYRLHLRPYETRLLFVELSGFNSSSPPPRRPPPKKKETKKQEKKEDDKEKSPGKITVYSKPPGVVIVDGDKKGEKTPGSVELDNGRHEVQVQYESGSMSEKKIVRVRTGSRIKLFFRERK